MTLRWVASVLGRRLTLLLVTMAIAAGAGYASAPRGTLYRARATLFVGQSALAYDPATGQQNALSVQIGELNAYTLARLISSVPTARFAAGAAGVARAPEVVAAETSAVPVLSTELVTVTVVDPDPGVAARLANAVPVALNQELAALDPVTAGHAQPSPAVLYTRAEVPTSPIRSHSVPDALLAIPFGLVIAIAAAVVAELLQPTIAAGGQAEAILGLPVLGSTRRRRIWIPHRRPLVVGAGPVSPARR